MGKRVALYKDIAAGVRYTMRSDLEIKLVLRGLKLLLKSVEKKQPDNLPLQMMILNVYRKADLHRKKYFR